MINNKNIKKYIEFIISEIGYLSIQKECFFMIKKLIEKDIESNIYLKHCLYENLIYTYVIKLFRILEKPKKGYEDDANLYSIYKFLKLPLEKFDEIYNLNSYIHLKNFRHKRIGHLTEQTINIAWKELDEILQYTQDLANTALYKIEGITITDWQIPLKLITDAEFKKIPWININFENGRWGFHN